MKVHSLLLLSIMICGECYGGDAQPSSLAARAGTPPEARALSPSASSPASPPIVMITPVRPTPLSLPDQAGSTEWSLTSGVATGMRGGAANRGYWNIDLRWGRVLTSFGDHGPFRGTLEYALEIEPVVVIRQMANAFGGGITPLVLQYNFVGSRFLVPFIEAGVGTQYTGLRVPEDTSKINFTPQGGIGAYLFRRPSSAIAMGIRYHHTSNAGLHRPNPGHNNLYFYTGFSWWR